MALGTRALSRVQSTGSGLGNAKKLADLYIKTHTNDSGDVTDPEVYSYVVNNILAPYAGTIDGQRTIAGYQNKFKDLSSKAVEDDASAAAFKQNELDAIYMRDDGVIRDPATMAQTTSLVLDDLLVKVDAAIASQNAANKSTASLAAYRRDLANRADGMRDLTNAIASGTAPPNLDGYGMYVRTSPLDGSFYGVAFLPVDSAPTEITNGMKRVENAGTVGNSKLPVYLPTVKNADGDVVAKFGNNTWTGSSEDPTLSPDKTSPNFGDAATPFSLDLRDSEDSPYAFNIKKNDIPPLGFGQAATGRSVNGIPEIATYFRGADNKVYQLDQPTLQKFQQDPIMREKLGSYITTLSPDEVKGLGTVSPIADDQGNDIYRTSRTAVLRENVAASQQEQAKLAGQQAFFDTLLAPQDAVVGAVKRAGAFVGEVAGKVGSFFGVKNRQSTPDPAKESVGGYTDPRAVLEKGRSFFGAGAPPTP